MTKNSVYVDDNGLHDTMICYIQYIYCSYNYFTYYFEIYILT